MFIHRESSTGNHGAARRACGVKGDSLRTRHSNPAGGGSDYQRDSPAHLNRGRMGVDETLPIVEQLAQTAPSMPLRIYAESAQDEENL